MDKSRESAGSEKAVEPFATIKSVVAGLPPLPATTTIRQKSNGRFLDAHEIAGKDFRLVTRAAQNNDTQRWVLLPVGDSFTIQQLSNGRFVDAYDSAENDFSVVTRPAKNNDAQHWILEA